jgi:inner membrane protein
VASAFSHAVVALMMGHAVRHRLMDRRALVLGVVCSILPDADVIGFHFGIAYGDLWGHRGITHSLLFAALVSAVMTSVWYRGNPRTRMAWMGGYLFLCTASHGVLDALTDGGLGVAFLAPFDTSRYFFSVRPVLVSPIEIPEFFSRYGLRVLASEVVWIWLPSIGLFVLVRAAWWRRSRSRPTDYPR